MDQKKRKGHSKINEQIKRSLYTWITRHPQGVQTPISNNCLKVMLDDQTKPQLVPKLLLHVFVIELHNSLVSDPNDGGLKDVRDEDGNIIISYSTLRSLLPPQFKNSRTLQDYVPRKADISSSFLVYTFVDLSGEDSCLYMEQMFLSFNESLP